MANSFQSGETPAPRATEKTLEAGMWGTDGGAASRRSAEDSTASVGSDLEDAATTATDTLWRQAGDVARSVGDELSRTGEHQKARGAEALHRFAGAIGGAADDLEEQSPTVARVVRETARRVDGLSNQLTNRNVNELIDQATEFARAKPALFIGGSVAAGFALARFLGSSARRGSYPARERTDRTRD